MTEKEAKSLADYLRGDHSVNNAEIHSNGPGHRYVVHVTHKGNRKPAVTIS